MKTLVLGAWHLGSVHAACLASPENQVYVFDQDAKVMASWEQGKAPLFEPGLQDLIDKNWNKNLFCLKNLEQTFDFDWVVVAYDTPIDDQDLVLLDSVDRGIELLSNCNWKPNTQFFLTAQLPVGNSRRYAKQIKARQPQWVGGLYYSPENLRLGEAIKSFMTPDRVVLGIEPGPSSSVADCESNFRKWSGLSQVKINLMSVESAEMVKHALNSFLATCVVFGNELSEICETTSANAWDVVASLKQDSRVGPRAFLRPGLGFAGGTLARDIQTLKGLSTSKNKGLFGQLFEINQRRNDWVINSLEAKLKSLKAKKIVLLGVTYKPDTSTVRRSPAVDIANLLKNKGATCVALDPMADLGELKSDERQGLAFELNNNPDYCFSGADAAVLVTEWPQFLELDWTKIKSQMRTAVVVDTKNHLSKIKSRSEFQIVIPGLGDPKV
jgi:UDPglucose 6-dehydrogenase